MTSYLKTNFIILIALFSFTIPVSTFLCSAFCQPGSCTGTTFNDCTGCPTNRILNVNRCDVDPSSGYTAIDYSNDVVASGGVTLTTQSLNLFVCGSMTLKDAKKCSNLIVIEKTGGIGSPHYSYEVTFFLLLVDDTAWSSSNKITMFYTKY